jgi:hypothetical protein
VDCDSDDAEGKQQEPHDGIQGQCHQSEWPADNEQKTPERECSHGKPPLLVTDASGKKFIRLPAGDRIRSSSPFENRKR